EAGAADHLVVDADAYEIFLERAALGVGAVEDRHIAPLITTVAVQAIYFVGTPLRLVGFFVGVIANDLLAVALVGPQLFGFARHVVRDDRVRGVENRLRRSVVLLEQNDRRLGEGLLELQDVANVRAAELVDR